MTSLLAVLNMACTLFGLTPEEALAGVTRNAARALGLADRGTLAVGQARRPRALADRPPGGAQLLVRAAVRSRSYSRTAAVRIPKQVR